MPETREPEMGLTFEKVWAMFQESDRRMREMREETERRLQVLRLNKDKKGDKRKIYGALAGAVMTDTVHAAALKEGLYVIAQSGDTVKIDVPGDFIPRAW
jgi:hypothetical protein